MDCEDEEEEGECVTTSVLISRPIEELVHLIT